MHCFRHSFWEQCVAMGMRKQLAKGFAFPTAKFTYGMAVKKNMWVEYRMSISKRVANSVFMDLLQKITLMYLPIP